MTITRILCDELDEEWAEYPICTSDGNGPLKEGP